MECSPCRSALGLNFGSTVPQGSILGSLHFSIYVNDLSTVVRHSQINMYVDDTELHLSGHDLLSVSMIFSVILMLFMPGCVSIDFN